jgi:CheY-like chemotaxis protein
MDQKRPQQFATKTKQIEITRWVVALTAHAMKGDQERCLAVGVNDNPSKPTGAQELDAVLGTGVARRVAKSGLLAHSTHSPRNFARTLFLLLHRHD